MPSQLQRVLQVLEPRLKRQRPLARACPQLLLDLAALLEGLRPLIMLDHAAGVTPAQLLQALQPLPQLLPDFYGCILHLDGCCYLADSLKLQLHLHWLTKADVSSNISWPAVISFGEAAGQAALAQPEQCKELQQQLGVFWKGVQEQLEPWQQQQWEQQQQQQQAAVLSAEGHTDRAQPPMQHHSISSSSSSSTLMPVIDLGRVRGLPAMPTLNGFLLGYPAVYWVRSLQEAAAASKVLSTSRLRLHRVHGNCPALAAFGCDSSSGRSIAGRRMALLSFTVPEALCDDAFESKVQQLLARLQRAAASVTSTKLLIDTRTKLFTEPDGTEVEWDPEWTDIELSMSEVDAQPVSL
uniref:Uncharacterized protein n=1 Tax=Tetradesmus obliquus TaxID=3088 RepID=A0A383WD02_TETOB|eukprot:jgi/Sobl393_1/15245/SZX75113.1